MSSSTPAAIDDRGQPLHRTIWRWHFYAGLFCIPFILWLATTGAVYLFKPQIEAWLDRDVDQLVIDGPHATAEAQVQAALAAVPGARFAAYELPASPTAAVRVLVKSGTGKQRVYIDPQRLTVLKLVDDEQRLMPLVSRLHGELLIGKTGSYLVELAASWAILMLLSGLYLWWPREGRGIAGVLLPRLGARGRLFWRDLHAVIGFWVSALALFLLVSGLPWTSFWGGNLSALRQYAASAELHQDWTTGGEHAGHQHGAAPAADSGYELAALDRLVATVAPLALAPPVLIAPPGKDGADWTGIGSPTWTARSEAQNRPLRATLALDGVSGAVLSRTGFAQHALLDRVIETGVAAHEGQLFGWLNQALGLFTALGLITLAISAIALWWRRRPIGRLGAPLALGAPRVGYLLIAAIVVLGVLLPLFGASLLAVLLLERTLLRRLPRARHFLGLDIT